MDRLVAQDVLVLLGDADHLVPAAEREDLREAGVEPHALEDHVERDEVAQERLVGGGGAGGEVGVGQALGVAQRPGVLVGDRRDLAVHVEQLALVQAEALADVLERVGVHGLLERLAQQVLAALGVGEVAVDREHDVVGDQRLRGGEEAEVALEHRALVLGEPVAGLPQRDVGLHGDLGRHPVVAAAGEVLLPRPAVLQRQQLVDVRARVDHALGVGVDAAAGAVDRAEAGGGGERSMSLAGLAVGVVDAAGGAVDHGVESITGTAAARTGEWRARHSRQLAVGAAQRALLDVRGRLGPQVVRGLEALVPGQPVQLVELAAARGGDVEVQRLGLVDPLLPARRGVDQPARLDLERRGVERLEVGGDPVDLAAATRRSTSGRRPSPRPTARAP